MRRASVGAGGPRLQGASRLQAAVRRSMGPRRQGAGVAGDQDWMGHGVGGTGVAAQIRRATAERNFAP